MSDKPLVRILRMRKVSFIDATGLHNLEVLVKSSKSEGIEVVLSGVNPGVRSTLEHAGFDKLIPEDHICDHITKAVAMANSVVARIQTDRKTKSRV